MEQRAVVIKQRVERLRRRGITVCMWCNVFELAYRPHDMERHERLECSQRPNADKRMLQRCGYPGCGEWFNTTEDIFLDHEAKHVKGLLTEADDDIHCDGS